MNRHQLGAVGERGLDLNVVNHFGDAIHHLRAGENVGTRLHELRHGLAVARALDHVEERVLALIVTAGARQAALLGPPAVAVHPHGHVGRHAGAIQRLGNGGRPGVGHGVQVTRHPSFVRVPLYARQVTSYDPDDPTSFGEFDESVGRQLDNTASEATGDAAVEFLAKVTSHLPGGGEDRLGQQEMTRRVAEAFSRGEHLVVEAGTGIGKSLAYLTPAALTRTRVVIATATKNLQDQLAAKDAPLVAAQMPGLKVAVLKGRQNYLCLNRARGVTDGAQLSFDDGDDVPKGIADQMKRILTWSNNTSTGDRDELPFEVEERAWRQMSVTPQECLGRADCPQGGSCWAELARDRASSSDLVIVNAHLYASHLATDGNVLPSHEYVIFDEAHEILDIFAGMLGTALKTRRGKDLYAYWGDTVAHYLNERLQDRRAASSRPVIVNLASQEYAKVALRPSLQARVVDCQFEDWKGDRYKVISFFAKRARGLMARWAIEHRVKSVKQLQDFQQEGYALDASVSSEDRWIFRRHVA